MKEAHLPPCSQFRKGDPEYPGIQLPEARDPAIVSPQIAFPNVWAGQREGGSVVGGSVVGGSVVGGSVVGGSVVGGSVVGGPVVGLIIGRLFKSTKKERFRDRTNLLRESRETDKGSSGGRKIGEGEGEGGKKTDVQQKHSDKK